MHPHYGTQNPMKPFTLTYDGKPVYAADSWLEAAAAAVQFGLARWAFNCLYVPVLGAKIQCKTF